MRVRMYRNDPRIHGFTTSISTGVWMMRGPLHCCESRLDRVFLAHTWTEPGEDSLVPGALQRWPLCGIPALPTALRGWTHLDLQQLLQPAPPAVCICRGRKVSGSLGHMGRGCVGGVTSDPVGPFQASFFRMLGKNACLGRGSVCVSTIVFWTALRQTRPERNPRGDTCHWGIPGRQGLVGRGVRPNVQGPALPATGQ